jgi:hypothetical protein
MAQLIVNDGLANSLPATVTIQTNPLTAPVANAGPDQKVNVDAVVQLDGSASSDVDGHQLTFQWSLITKPSGSTAALSDPAAVKPTFTADLPGTYVAQLIVSDLNVSSKPATVTITTNAVLPPTANPGSNQTVAHNTTVTLNGGGTDPQGFQLTFRWALLSTPAGSTASLSSTTTANTTFFADKPGTYVAQLIVNNGFLDSAPATITISTTNTPPVANAGPAQNVTVGATVTLDGSGSSDADHDPITYSWSFTSRPPNSTATLTGATTVSPAFVADLMGTYVVQLIVSDPYSSSSPVTVTITAGAGQAASISATAGSGQSAQINTAFASPLVATVKDAGGNPVSGVTVTFTAPGSGASGTFANGANTAVTNASGVATSAIFTANSVAGSYTVTASVQGASGPANFSLTNNPGPPASITATGGSDQTAQIDTAFANPLAATVKDSAGNPVPGVTVIFTAPSSGASGAFTGGNTAVTNASGTATSNVFTANNTAGSYTVTASVPGVGAANFSLTNTNGAPAAITATGGSGQSAQINTAFANPLVATVKDAGGNPVGGVTVTFTAPGSGPSGSFANGANTAVTNASGVATSATFTANGTAGAYTVTASVAGASSPANFSLTNTSGQAASVTATGGSGQSAPINTAFASPLSAAVKDSGGNPISGVTVTFTAPATGASGSFANGGNTAVTNSSGVATSAVFTANATAGSYTVTVSVSGLPPASFSLTNIAGPPASITATAGSGQTAQINSTFASPLSATVKDAGGNPVSGVTVTFSAPTSGPGGSFAGGANTAVTNAAGVATSALFTANGVAGSYTVTASVSGVSTPASFTLTNQGGTSGSITVGNGSVGQNLETQVAITLPAPAGTGGVNVTVTSSDPGNVLVAARSVDSGAASITVPVAEGLNSFIVFVLGLGSSGTVSITASAPAAGFGSGTGTITLTPSGFMLSGPNGIGVPSFSTSQGVSTTLTVTAARLDSSFNFAEAQPLRIGASASVTITSSNPGVGAVATSPVNFNGGDTTATTQFNALSSGATTLTAGTPSGFSTPTSGNTLNVTVSQAGLVPSNATVGNNLETTATVTLNGVAPSGGLTVTVTSNDPSKLLLSTDPAAVGQASLPLQVPAGLNHTQAFYVQGLGSSGTVTYSASADGFGSNTGTVTLTPSGIVIAGPGGIGGPPIQTSSGAPATTITIFSAQLDGTGAFVAVEQLRGGFSASANVTSSNTSVGTITASPISIAGGDFSATTLFQPVASGKTNISVSAPPGFNTPSSAFTTVEADVSTPGIAVTSGITIGNNLENIASVTLGQPAPAGGLTVTLTSNNSSLLRLSATATDAGSGTLNVTVPAGSNNATYYIQVFGSSGTASYTASASGFNSGAGTIALSPSGVALQGPFGFAFPNPFTTTTTSPPTQLGVFMAQLDSGGNFVTTQPLAGGINVSVSLASSNPAVGTVPPQVTVSGGSDNAAASLTPHSPGQVTISLTTPPGFTALPVAYTTVSANVTQ